MMNLQSRYNICYITNKNYLFQTYVSMFSLKQNKHRNVNYDVYLLCIEFNDCEKILELNSDDFCINPIFIKRNIFTRNDNVGVVYYKLLLHELLDCDTVFHIDADTVVIKDISEIFKIDISEYCVAAVKDKINSIGYFNAGNIYMNLCKIRNYTKFSSSDTMYTLYMKTEKEIEGKNPRIYLWEQDIFNKLFLNDVLYLNYGYNFLPNKYGIYNFNEYGRIYGEKIQSDNIKILHFASNPKPWIKADLFGKIWQMYAENRIDKILENKILKLACREYKK